MRRLRGVAGVAMRFKVRMWSAASPEGLNRVMPIADFGPIGSAGWQAGACVGNLYTDAEWDRPRLQARPERRVVNQFTIL